MLPRERRDAMYAVYAFCREIDDIADDPAPAGDKIARLKDWRGEIDRLYAGEPGYPTARALAVPIQRFGFDRREFLDIIDGMEMDAVEDIRAPSFEKLETYCDRVASAVGRLSVCAFGAPGPAGRTVARHLGQALQLTNILRDLDEDAGRGRLYLPRELLDKAGIAGDAPQDVLRDDKVGGACTALADRAQQRYEDAEAALRACPRRAMRPARMMMHVYRETLDRLEARGWTRLDEPVRLPKWRKLWILLRYGLI